MFKLALQFLFSLGFFYFLLVILRKTKGFQAIYDLSPARHQGKAQTVSFGGVGIVFSVLFGVLLFHIVQPVYLWVILLFLSFSIIGFLDDLLSSVHKQNKGLSAKQKFWIQLLVGAVFVEVFHVLIHPIGFWEKGLYLFMIVGASNATNLTDGLDGLLGGLSLTTLFGFSLFFWKLGRMEGVFLCGVVSVAVGAFLVYNHHPAKMFMGDTGSLALGTLFAGLAIVSGNPFVLIPLGGVYILETLSVVIQVSVFKHIKRRIFLMAPLHHHFELMGLSEWETVLLFWTFGVVFLIIFVQGMGS